MKVIIQDPVMNGDGSMTVSAKLEGVKPEHQGALVGQFATIKNALADGRISTGEALMIAFGMVGFFNLK